MSIPPVTTRSESSNSEPLTSEAALTAMLTPERIEEQRQIDEALDSLNVIIKELKSMKLCEDDAPALRGRKWKRYIDPPAKPRLSAEETAIADTLARKNAAELLALDAKTTTTRGRKPKKEKPLSKKSSKPKIPTTIEAPMKCEVLSLKLPTTAPIEDLEAAQKVKEQFAIMKKDVSSAAFKFRREISVAPRVRDFSCTPDAGLSRIKLNPSAAAYTDEDLIKSHSFPEAMYPLIFNETYSRRTTNWIAKNGESHTRRNLIILNDGKLEVLTATVNISGVLYHFSSTAYQSGARIRTDSDEPATDEFVTPLAKGIQLNSEGHPTFTHEGRTIIVYPRDYFMKK